MTELMPDPRFHLDDFARTCLNESADGYRAGVLWLATCPPWAEVSSVDQIHRDLHDGGATGCDSRHYNADHYGSFIDFLRHGPYEPQVIDGEAEMAAINEAQGTDYPAWPKRAFSVSFDCTFLLGFAAACHTALKMGSDR